MYKHNTILDHKGVNAELYRMEVGHVRQIKGREVSTVYQRVSHANNDKTKLLQGRKYCTRTIEDDDTIEIYVERLPDRYPYHIARDAVEAYVNGNLHQQAQAVNLLKPYISPDAPITCDGHIIFVDVTVVGSPITIKRIDHV